MKVKFILLIAAAVALAACNKNGGNEDDKVNWNSPNGTENYTVNAVGVIEYGGAGDVVTVAAVAYSFDDIVTRSFLMSARSRTGMRGAETRAVGGNVLATSPYVNKGFRFTLTTPTNDMLEGFPAPPPGSTITVSDLSARTSMAVEVEAHDAAGEYIDDFWFETDDFSIYAQYMYADKDVSITGSYTTTDEEDGTYKEEYNVHLKKGWNLTYYEEGFVESTNTYTFKMYTTPPAGKSLRWDFGFIGE